MTTATTKTRMECTEWNELVFEHLVFVSMTTTTTTTTTTTRERTLTTRTVSLLKTDRR